MTTTKTNTWFPFNKNQFIEAHVFARTETKSNNWTTPKRIKLTDLPDSAKNAPIHTKAGQTTLKSYLNHAYKNWDNFTRTQKAICWDRIQTALADWNSCVVADEQANQQKKAIRYEVNELIRALRKLGLSYSRIASILRRTEEYIMLAPQYEVELPRTFTASTKEYRWIPRTESTKSHSDDDLPTLLAYRRGIDCQAELDWSSKDVQYLPCNFKVRFELEEDNQRCALQTAYYLLINTVSKRNPNSKYYDTAIDTTDIFRKRNRFGEVDTPDLDPAPTTYEEYIEWKQKHFYDDEVRYSKAVQGLRYEG